MTLFRKLICDWSGHDLRDHRSRGDECHRCGQYIEWHEWGGLKLRITHYWRYHRPHILRSSYYQKCPDCGLRFNRHTGDCPPF